MPEPTLAAAPTLERRQTALLHLVAVGAVYEPVWGPGTLRAALLGDVTGGVMELKRRGLVEYIAPTRDLGIRLSQAAPTDAGHAALARALDGAPS